MHNNLYALLEKTDQHCTLRLAGAEHDVFKAHFPGNPLLPGFLLIDFCEIEFQLEIKKIKKISFLQKILPEQLLYLSLQTLEEKCRLDVMVNKELVAFIDFEVC